MMNPLSSLRSRIFLASALLAVLCIAVAISLVNVTVTDPYDRVVTGLEPDNFRVFENNVEQEIQY